MSVRYANPADIRIQKDENGLPVNPRGVIRDTTDLQESIREAGRIIEPLLLRRGADGALWVMDGHRRLVAARKLGMDVPYVLVDAQNGLDPVDVMLTSNVRKDFPHIVLDKDGTVIGGLAKAVRDKLATSARTRESLARLMGVRPDVVSAYEQLVTAPVSVRRAVASGRMSITAFARMKHAPPSTQREIVKESGEAVTVSKVRDGIRQAKEEQDEGEGPGEDSAVEGLNEALALLQGLRAQSWPVSRRELFLVQQIHESTEEILECKSST